MKLVGTDTNNIIESVELLLNDEDEYQRMSFSHNPYGDGNATKKIIEVLSGLRD